MILLVVQKDRLVMSLHVVKGIFYKRIYDTILQAEVDIYKKELTLPRFEV